jgi:hypothetical protein
MVSQVVRNHENAFCPRARNSDVCPLELKEKTLLFRNQIRITDAERDYDRVALTSLEPLNRVHSRINCLEIVRWEYFTQSLNY